MLDDPAAPAPSIRSSGRSIRRSQPLTPFLRRATVTGGRDRSALHPLRAMRCVLLNVDEKNRPAELLPTLPYTDGTWPISAAAAGW